MCMKIDQRLLDDVKKSFKWMWCCYQAMSRQAVDLMSEVLHLMLISSNALTIKCNARHAAFDRETIKCTLTIVLMSELLHSISSRSDEKQLIFKLLHSIAIKLNALTMLFDVRKTASDRNAIKYIDEIVWLSDCCIWCQCHQMHADNCLIDAN